MERKAFLFLMVLGIALFTIPSFVIGQTNYPLCESFGIQRIQEKKVAPSFSLKEMTGKQVTLSDFKGKPILFMFMASWCSACKEEIVLIEKFAQGKKEQLTIFLIAIDGENEKRIQRIIKDKKITLPVLLDVKEKIARTYGIRMVPTAFLINEEGVMAAMIVGQRDWSSPEAWSAVRELLSLR